MEAIMATPEDVRTRLAEVRRRERIDIRLTAAEKELITRAAASQEMDRSAFARRALLDRARKLVTQTERIHLSGRDFERVMELLENPPKVSPALRKAVAARRRSQ
ncbi:MAG: DUF1778 domain-containing protein [Alphaproteobacteria bacterium]|nr:DUF1778 domain-containing protein [Alphaproteobacteria bacterium]